MKIGFLAILAIIFTIAISHLSFNEGWEQHRLETSPMINLDEKHIHGLIYPCPPSYISGMVAEPFSDLDTVHNVVTVMQGDSVLGYFLPF